MKKSISIIAGLATLLAVSCTQEKLENPAAGEVTVSFAAELPAGVATKAYGEAENVDALTYFVYDAGQTKLLNTGNATVTNGVANVHLTLVKGKSYDILFWAQSSEATAYTVENQTLTVDYTKLSSNKDENDAFYKFDTFPITGPLSTKVQLYRPFAQINLGTNDAGNADAKYFPTHSEMTATLPNVLNLNTKETSGEVTVRTYAKNEVAEGNFPVADYKYLAMNYVLVGKDQTTTDLVFNLYDEQGATLRNTVTVSNAPIQQNYRTNIYGALLTDEANFEIEVVPGFDEPANDFDIKMEVSDEVELARALENGGTVKLLNDIVIAKQLAVAENVVLDLNGHTISNTADLWSTTNKAWSLISVQNGTTFVKNGTLDPKENDCYAIDVRNGAKVVVENGTYAGNVSVVYVFEGEAEIKGGEFSLKQLNDGKCADYALFLNCHDGNHKAGKANITVTGGSFKNFNPENNAAERPGTNFVTGDNRAFQDGENWVVKACEVVEVASLDELNTIISTKAHGNNRGGDFSGKIIKLTADLEFPDGANAQMVLDNASDFTFDGNGHTIKNFSHPNSDRAAFIRKVGNNFLIKNVTFDNAYIYSNSGECHGKNSAIVLAIVEGVNGKIENVTVQNSKTNIGNGVGVIIGSTRAVGEVPIEVTLRNCNIINTEIKGSFRVGGFVGYKTSDAVTLSFGDCSMDEATKFVRPETPFNKGNSWVTEYRELDVVVNGKTIKSTYAYRLSSDGAETYYATEGKYYTDGNTCQTADGTISLDGYPVNEL